MAYAKELGLTTKAVLVAGAHDQYAVALGAGALNSGDILIGSGTCWVLTALNNSPDFESGLSQSVSAAPGLLGSVRSLSSGGICLDWLRNQVSHGAELTYDEINRESSKRKAAEDGLFFLPFAGKSDDKQRLKRASFVGLDLSHDCFDMSLAVMEGVGSGIYDSIESGYKHLAVEEKIILPNVEKHNIYSPLFEEYKKRARLLK